MSKIDGTFELPFATVHFRKDKIIHIHYKSHLFTLRENKFIFRLIKRKAGKRAYPLMVSSDDFSNHDIESKEFFAGTEIADHCSAIGFVVRSVSQKLAIKFFLRIYKPKVTARYFVSEADALEWLCTFKKIVPKKAVLD